MLSSLFSYIGESYQTTTDNYYDFTGLGQFYWRIQVQVQSTDFGDSDWTKYLAIRTYAVDNTVLVSALETLENSIVSYFYLNIEPIQLLNMTLNYRTMLMLLLTQD